MDFVMWGLSTWCATIVALVSLIACFRLYDKVAAYLDKTSKKTEDMPAARLDSGTWRVDQG